MVKVKRQRRSEVESRQRADTGMDTGSMRMSSTACTQDRQ